MPNTYSQIYLQIVFAVKNRQYFINEEIRENLQKFITGIISNKGQKLIAMYCMPDHTHLLISIQPSVAVSDLVRDVKANSTTWLKNNYKQLDLFSWQEGFGIFSYSKSQQQKVVDYIINQPLHHKKKSFREEYIEFLNAFEIEFKEEYLFEFY